MCLYIFLCDCDCDFYYINCFFVILTNNAWNTKRLAHNRQYIVLLFSRNFVSTSVFLPTVNLKNSIPLLHLLKY